LVSVTEIFSLGVG